MLLRLLAAGAVASVTLLLPPQVVTEAKRAPAEMVFVPEGPAVLGGAEPSAFPGPSLYRVDGFWIDRFEVTNRQYTHFIQVTGRPAPAFADDPELAAPDLPVTGVTWQDAADYCSWAGKRLPTEVEWEKAARGEDGRVYPWGDEDRGQAHLSGSAPLPVGRSSGDVSPYGIQDMAGNVSEWVADLRIAGQVCENGAAPYTGNEPLAFRAYLRGGNFQALPHMARSYQRIWDYTDTVSDFFGFRCAWSDAHGREIE